MTRPALLAKSPRADGDTTGRTLAAHTAMVIAATRALVEARGAAALAAMRLPATDLDALRRLALAGALLHDLGKSSDHFQAMVRGQRARPQLASHEALSLLLTLHPPIEDWLTTGFSPSEIRVAAAAAAGHHRRFPTRAVHDGSGDSAVSCAIDHPGFLATLAAGASSLGLTSPPVLPSPVEFRADRRPRLDVRLENAAADCQDAIDGDRRLARLLPLVKGFVLAGDVAGSALPGSGEGPGWIAASLGARADAGALGAVATDRLEGRPLRPFQRAVAACDAPLALVRAGCGTGKTAAAWLWAARHAGRQIWFTYPTTGTATEGFRDYLVDADLGAELMHGRASVDLDILDLRRDGPDGGDCRDQDRLAALRHWGASAVSCTADTVLGLLRNNRRGLYALPGLAHAAVVFDEIHAYDARMFGALLRFLRALPGTPALLMTASLPDGRLGALDRLCQEVHGRPLAVFDGPEGLESVPRYRREPGDPWAAAARVHAEGGKVLWVSNTVDRCRAAGEEAARRGLAPLVYHSRFRYKDRVARHADVIAAFRSSNAAFATTTQVAELSLDLSADLLVTDLAPVPALIQRLGRLNRRAAEDGSSGLRGFAVRTPDSALPYDAGAVAGAGAWLDALGDGPLSQRDLVAAWDQAPGGERFVLDSEWLDGGAEARVSHLRETSAPSIAVLLPADAAAARRDAARYALPMPAPRGLPWSSWPRVGVYPVAPDGLIDYDPLRGARWRA